MRILWFPRLQMDIDKLHITTWREMCKELRLLGHRVEIAISGKYMPGIFDPPYIHVPIIPVKFLRLFTFFAFGFVKFFIEYLRLRPNAVILDIFSVWFGVIPFFGARRRCTIVLDNRTPFYYDTSEELSLQDAFFRIYTRIAYLYCRLLGGAITTITGYYKETLCRDFKMPMSRIGVWGSGVDDDRFSPVNYARAENLFPWKGKFVIIQHGEVSYNRGIFETIKAMSIINDDKIALVILGSAINNQKIHDEVAGLIYNLMLSQRVYRISAVPYTEVPRYLNSADCAVMPYPNIEYWNNNNPIKLLEYLSMGKVVICTDMWTFRDVCGTNKCAVYIKDNEPKTIADAIVWCYKNRDNLNEWGREGMDIIKRRFTWKRQAANLVNFIKDIKRKDESIAD